MNNVIKQEKTSVLASLTKGTSGTFMEIEPGKNMDESQFITNLEQKVDDMSEDISEDNMEDADGDDEDSEGEVEEMEEEEQEKTILRPIKKKEIIEEKKGKETAEDEFNIQRNRNLKKQQKQLRKEKKKAVAYNFATDFKPTINDDDEELEDGDDEDLEE